MSGEQLSIPGLDPESTESTPGAAVSDFEASAGSLQPRTPGWALLADPDPSTNLWHRVASRRYDGVLTAVCGTTGRYIEEAEREIICCSACESAVI